MSFKIIVDSCCDLTPALLREDCFVSVPLTIRVGEHVVVDDASFDQGDLLWRMKESATAPQSSCPSPIQYLEAFDCGADNLYVSPSLPCSPAPTIRRPRPGISGWRITPTPMCTSSTPAPPRRARFWWP